MTAFWWEGRGENRKRIKGRERPDGDCIEPKPKYVMDSNLSCRGQVKRKNTNTKRTRFHNLIYLHHLRVYLRWIIQKEREATFIISLTIQTQVKERQANANHKCQQSNYGCTQTGASS
jgi:hypothetical protein